MGTGAASHEPKRFQSLRLREWGLCHMPETAFGLRSVDVLATQFGSGDSHFSALAVLLVPGSDPHRGQHSPSRSPTSGLLTAAPAAVKPSR